VEFLLGKGAGIDVPGSGGVTALYAATKYDRPDVARLLVSRGADVDRATKSGLTPLIWTAYAGNFLIAELLVAHGARADVRDRLGMSALYWALLMRFQFESGGGRIALAEHLLRLSQDQQAAAWAEAKNMRKQWREVALLLIEHGADVNASPSGGPATPLYFAANVDDLPLTEALIDKGADLNPARNCGCESPLHAAIAERRRDVAELLIRRGADVNDRNQSNRTPLHFLARDIDDPALAELMIARGAWVNATDKDGNTPLDFALGMGHLKVARVLQMRGGVRSDQIPNHRELDGQHST
jgi:cytohesin